MNVCSCNRRYIDYRLKRHQHVAKGADARRVAVVALTSGGSCASGGIAISDRISFTISSAESCALRAMLCV